MLRHILPGKVAAACVIALAAMVPPANADPLTISRGFFTVGGTFGVDLGFYTPATGVGDPAPFVGEGNGHDARAARGLLAFRGHGPIEQ